MKPNPRIIAMLGNQEVSKFFFAAIRFQRNQLLNTKKLTWNWAEKGHKVYPSGLKSLTMCPHRYVHHDVHKPPSFSIEAIYKMEMGTYMHNMYQDAAKEIDGLLYKDPDFSSVIFPGQEDIEKQLVHKYKNEIAPEVPVVDFHSGVSGRADAVLNMYGKPVVFDIKTTSVEDAKFDEKTGEWEVDRWNQALKKFPSEEHKIQVGIYCYLLNKWKYYDQPVRKAGLGYVNLLMKQGDPNAEYETYFDFDEEREARIGLLLEHIGRERTAFLEERESQCEYPYCRAHNLTRTIKELTP